MSSIEEIPAFSIWQTFSDTLAALMKMGYSKGSVEKLSKIIRSKDFSNIFVYERDSSLSFESYKSVSDKYKSFTTWLLGCFFYLSCCDKYKNVHNIIIDSQIIVLEQLSKSQLHIYEEMTFEYSKVLSNLTNFHKLQNEKLQLNVFIPKKHEDLKLDLSPVSVEINKRNYWEIVPNVCMLFKFILNENFRVQSFSETLKQNLNNFLYLLSEGCFRTKFEILSTYLQMLEKSDRNMDVIVLHKMYQFLLFFEQIIYEVYNQKFVLAENEFRQFEKLIEQFLNKCPDDEKLIKISQFLLEKTFAGSLIPSATLLKSSLKKAKSLPQIDCSMAFTNYNSVIFCGLESEIIDDIKTYIKSKEGREVVLNVADISKKWSMYYQMALAEKNSCETSCSITNFLAFYHELVKILFKIVVSFGEDYSKLIFFTEDDFLLKIITRLNLHFSKCELQVDFRLLFDFFIDLALIFNFWNLLVWFDIFAFPLSKSLISLKEFSGSAQMKKELTEMFKNLSKAQIDQGICLKFLNKFLARIASNFVEIEHLQEIEDVYRKICRNYFGAQETSMQILIIKKLPHLLTLFNNPDGLISEILIPSLTSSQEIVLKQATQVLPKIICMAYSDFIKIIKFDPDKEKIKILIVCDKCHLNYNGHSKTVSKTEVIQEYTKGLNSESLIRNFSKIDLDLSNLTGTILKSLLKFLSLNNTELKLIVLETLPFCSNHILKFHCGSVARIWVEKCGDENEAVRMKFAEVIVKIIKFGQDNSLLSEQVKDEILDILIDTLTKLTKKSLQNSEYQLQESLLSTIDQLCNLKTNKIILPIVKNLIYFIMVPTSKHSLIAVNKFFKLAEKQNMKTNQLFKNYKQEICEVIVHLCTINQALNNQSLKTSLCKISVTLECYNSKNFLSRECQYLLPFFVSKLNKMGAVSKLIDEIALVVNVNIDELLASSYGNIFLHIFLNESREDFKKSMIYLEKVTKLSGPTLRRRNFSIILNELLINFHSKRDKVELALKLFSTEDIEGNHKSTQDYLQTKFLGILQHFDFKLMGNSNRKELILLSLADLFKFMGPKHIGPLRFKIIAMLRTADCSGFPELNCDVWDSFVRNCEVESLGPQLATIFVSILPLIKSYPKKINDIFHYLVLENENKTKEFIKDLFFVDDTKIDRSVDEVIKKYSKIFDDYSFKEKIRAYLKYLTHETVEVRVKTLKQLKLLFEKNREDLDQLILGYNGIDSCIVELIDILTLACREKDPSLKLASGELMGELGAVEPTHLPRRYAQEDSRKFIFFIKEDAFVINILNELARALQGEKNTINMDRFALAIQEILKSHEISPDESSNGNHLWKQFPESQQELMLPLLYSKYIISLSNVKKFPCPIYGSPLGSSFQTWLYNWTCSLISTLSQEIQSFSSVCLPAMRQDHKILMQFLPHLLLHSIIENSNENQEKAYTEIKAVINSVKNERKVDRKILEIRPFSVPNQVTYNIETTTPEEITRTQCTKAVFVILDFLNRWLREWQGQRGIAGSNDQHFINIKNFLERFCKLELAKCNFHCGEYPRALMYLEDYITDNPQQIDRHLYFLAEIYAQLDEPDGVAGVTALQTSEPSIEERILALEISGKLSDAAACYERMPPPLKLHHLQGLIRCYLDLDNVNTALNFARGASENHQDFGNMLFEMQAEPLWRLGRYEDLDTLLQKPEMKNNACWGVQIGKALLSFGQGDRHNFDTTIQKLKSQQVEFLGASSLEEGSYQHGYDYISRLHALNELQQVEKATYEMLLKPNDETFIQSIVNHLSKEWELRIKVVQESVRIIEPLLCLRRVAIEQSKRLLSDRIPSSIPHWNSLLASCWLLSAKTARSAGVHQQAYTYTLKAEEYAPKELFLEKAKLYWLREEHEQALTTLQRGLEVILPDSSKEAIASLPTEKKKLCAEAKLLIASYNDSVSNVDTEVNVVKYKEAIEVYTEWEKNLVCLAQFYDKIFQAFNNEDKDSSKGSDIQLYMINYFGKSLLYGTSFVYQSMPRLLSIWFDYGTRLLDVNDSSVKEERRNYLIKMTKLIDNFLKRLPSYIFLTAFSQLISRICHPQREVYIELKSIIMKLLLQYPQQVLWMMISVIKSGYLLRAKRCMEIFNDPNLKTITMTKLVKDFTNLAEKLIELCNKDIPPDVSTTTVSTLLRTLPRMLNKGDFSEIMIPTHKFRKLVLPNPDFSSSQHNPFPNHYVHIIGIDEEVTVLRSLQRPRKITFKGSDGKCYTQLLKPKDDLRKDFRLMEFNDIVNQLLSREPEARQRRLNIRLYSVAPLNEECGIIEWLPNLVGLRLVLLDLYKQRGLGMRNKDLKEASCNIRDPIAKKREVFSTVLLPKHPPILGEWFRRTFPDAQNWVFARTAYIRTTAVISMVGYILGLGDRHGENILFDSVNGDTVHVDFNCLFNKGETFEWPERVPFRLTHNMVAAMGPLGVEGLFRKSCACTLKVLRMNTATLMSIVTPFVYDPLVSWPRNAPSSAHETTEKTNEQAVDYVKNIELRLQGIVKTRTRLLSIPLSIDGQTNNLINEAISIDNLCQMYIGWGPYL